MKPALSDNEVSNVLQILCCGYSEIAARMPKAELHHIEGMYSAVMDATIRARDAATKMAMAGDLSRLRSHIGKLPSGWRNGPELGNVNFFRGVADLIEIPSCRPDDLGQILDARRITEIAHDMMTLAQERAGQLAR